MKGESPWTRFSQGISCDVQRGVQKLNPAGAEALRRILASLRGLPWRTLLVVLGVPLLLWALWKLPQWYAASWEQLTDPKDIARLENDTRTTLVQAVGGIALLAGLLFTWRNLRMTEQNSRQTLDLSRKGQINDRFIKAIEQLGTVDQRGTKKLEVRLGGIYALEQIAKDSPDDHHWQIMEVLTAYVREHAPKKEEEQRSQDEISPSETQSTQHGRLPPKLASDIQAVLTVVGRRTRAYQKGEDERLDLSYTDLRGADLKGAQLEGADLLQAQLEGASLNGVHLQGASLNGVHLQGANLTGAHLQGADLISANLQGANLTGAHLQKAFLISTNLQGANLTGAHLQKAFLISANLQGAGLWMAQLEGASLTNAQLQGADLKGAQLEGADLRADLKGAQLEGASLTRAELRGAINLTIEQLATVKILYDAHLDPPLLAQIQRLYPQLLERPLTDVDI